MKASFPGFNTYLMIGLSLLLVTGESMSQESGSLSRGDLYMYLADKTQHRSGWQIFYSSSGRLQALRDGQCDNGKWSTTEKGALCWHVTAWGDRSCETYVREDESVKMLRGEEISTAPEIIEGNTTNCPPVIFGSTVITGVQKVEDFGEGLFSSQQTLDLISGNTVRWEPGRGMHYAADFTLLKSWDGIKSEGSWHINGEGAICWDIPGWGPTPCEFYYLKDGVLMRYTNRKHSEAGEYLKGNQAGVL